MELYIEPKTNVLSVKDWKQSQVDIWSAEAKYCESHGWFHMAKGAEEITESFRENTNEPTNKGDQQPGT